MLDCVPALAEVHTEGRAESLAQCGRASASSFLGAGLTGVRGVGGLRWRERVLSRAGADSGRPGARWTVEGGRWEVEGARDEGMERGSPKRSKRSQARNGSEEEETKVESQNRTHTGVATPKVQKMNQKMPNICQIF